MPRTLAIAVLVTAVAGACSSGDNPRLARESGKKRAPSTTSSSSAAGSGAGSGAGPAAGSSAGVSAGVSAATPGGPLRLSSSAFKNNGAIPREYTCQGANQSLPLAWTIPRGTVSLALRMQDVDTDQQFVHWLVYGIKPQTTSVAAGQPPPGSVQAKNSFGNAQYTGPCPPLGQRHRYVFTLLALATELQVSNDVSPADLWATLERSAVVGKVELTGTYQRPEPGPPANSG